MTDNCPEHETFQEFVTGARYNKYVLYKLQFAIKLLFI